MEPNWSIIIFVLGISISLIALIIWRNLKDKKAFTKEMIDEEELDVQAKHLEDDDTSD